MKSMFFITNCVNTEIRGPVRAYHNPTDLPFTQGTIKEINNDKASGYNWVIQVHSNSQPAWSCNILEALAAKCMLPHVVTRTMLHVIAGYGMQPAMWWVQRSLLPRFVEAAVCDSPSMSPDRHAGSAGSREEKNTSFGMPSLVPGTARYQR